VGRVDSPVAGDDAAQLGDVLRGGQGGGWYGHFFFFQAEDGIRDGHVTGVQTCALPISLRVHSTRSVRRASDYVLNAVTGNWLTEIGRASCRERVEISVGAAS